MLLALQQRVGVVVGIPGGQQAGEPCRHDTEPGLELFHLVGEVRVEVDEFLILRITIDGSAA